jgi:integrase
MAAYRKLPSGLWQATVRLPDGTRRTRTDPLKGVVKTWAEDAEADMRRGEWADPQDGRITLAQWWDKWSRTRVIEKATTDRDASHWRTHVEPRWGRVKLAALTSWDVEAWVADMARAKVGATSAQQSVRLLRHMLADAAQHRLIKADPTANVKLPKVPKHVDRFLSLAEYDALEAAMPTERDRAMVRLMAYAGLRWSEVAGLHAHRVDLARRRLIVVEVQRRDMSIKDVPKSGAGQRFVPLGDELIAMLGPLVAQASESDGWRVFPGVEYTSWRRRVFVPAVMRAGLALPHPTPHDLRHTFGSWLAEAGVSPTDIMALLGHSSLRATERYLHSSSTRFDRAIVALRRPVEIEG